MADSKFTFLRRIRNVVPEELPLYARSVGHYMVNGSYVAGGTCKPHVELYWGVAGEGLFFLQGESYRVKPGYVCFYLPTDHHYLKPAGDYWEYWFMTFAGPLAEATIKGFGIPQKPFFAGNCPDYLFDMLGREIREDSYYSQRMASSLVYQIMAIASATRFTQNKTLRQYSDPFIQAVNLIRHSFSNPETSVDSIADTLGLHRITLTRQFQARLKMPPKKYMTLLRMEKATTLLASSELPIKKVAQLSGFNDPNYFEKVFRSHYKISPTDYRNKN